MFFVYNLPGPTYIKNKQKGNADPTLKPDFFHIIFQHKWMFPICRSQCGISV